MSSLQSPTPAAPPPPLQVAVRCRCPRCGQGHLYAGIMKLADRCSVCGLDLAANDNGDGPAVFLIFILGALIIPLALLVDAWFSPPLWVHAILWGIVLFGATIGMLRPAKAYVMALQYRHRRLAGDGGLDRVD